MKNLMLVFLMVFICRSIAYPVNTSEIEALRLRTEGAGSELTSSDKAVISKFLSDALNEMLLSKASVEMVEIRRQLESQKGNESLSYYVTAYIAQAKADLETAFNDVKRLEDSKQRQMLEGNLMILTAKLQSPQLAPLALQRLDDKDGVVRYWAYKAVTQPGIIQQLTSDVTRDEQARDLILNALEQKASTELLPEIQNMVVTFCGAIDHPTARKILLTIADRRISAYKDWTISDESSDTVLLTVLGNIAESNSDPEIKKQFGRAFAELYSLVIQRYSKGMNAFSPDQIDRILTVIAQVDQAVLKDTMGIKTNIVQSLRSKTGLEREYGNLFGDQMGSGQLSAKFKFDYGKDPSGKSLMSPPVLGPMPQKDTDQD